MTGVAGEPDAAALAERELDLEVEVPYVSEPVFEPEPVAEPEAVLEIEESAAALALPAVTALPPVPHRPTTSRSAVVSQRPTEAAPARLTNAPESLRSPEPFRSSQPLGATGQFGGPDAVGPIGLPDERATCTAPQLRRFIKSRAYVPMHELRRRFAIDSSEDDVTPVDLETRRVYLGLPEREGRLLGELLRGGDVGFELSLDPITPIVVGVYPLRPVPRA